MGWFGFGVSGVGWCGGVVWGGWCGVVWFGWVGWCTFVHFCASTVKDGNDELCVCVLQKL